MNISLDVSVWECQQLPLGERGGGTQSLECENEGEPSFLIPLQADQVYQYLKD